MDPSINKLFRIKGISKLLIYLELKTDPKSVHALFERCRFLLGPYEWYFGHPNDRRMPIIEPHKGLKAGLT